MAPDLSLAEGQLVLNLNINDLRGSHYFLDVGGVLFGKSIIGFAQQFDAVATKTKINNENWVILDDHSPLS